MKESIKKVSILVLALIVSIVSLAISPLTVKTAYATDISATVDITSSMIDSSILVWDLVKSTIYATGQSDILDNEDTLNELADIVSKIVIDVGSGNFMESPAYEAYKKQYPELAAMVGTGTIWNPAPTVNDNDDVIGWDTWHKDPLTGKKSPSTKVWDPVNKGWNVIPTPNGETWKELPWQVPYDKDNTETGIEQRKRYGWQEGQIFQKGEDALKDAFKKDHGGSSGGGGGDSGDSGNNSSKGTKVKIGTGILASVTALVVSLTSGKSGNEKIDSLMGTSENYIYTGIPASINKPSLKWSTAGSDSSGKYNIVHVAESARAFDRFGGYKISDTAYNFCSSIGSSISNDIRLSCNGVSTWYRVSDGSVYRTQAFTSLINMNVSASCNFPLFGTKEALINYLKTGDDSTAINKESKKLVWADVKSMAGKLPSTFNSLTNLPIGKALSSNALKDFNKDMTNYRKTASPDDLTNTDTLTKVATETMQKEVEKNTVDEKEKEDEDTKPAPMPEYPTPDKVDIDGSEATRDWRLVFPFCIPFDMIDLYRVFVAEPQAPHWEIPLKSETFNIDYTFVIDFEQFEVLAEIFRTFQIILFILGLCMITSKVIKW